MVSCSHRRMALALLLALVGGNSNTRLVNAFAPPQQSRASWRLFQSTASTIPTTSTPSVDDAVAEEIVDTLAADDEKIEHQSYSLDISKTIYTASIKSPKDSYIAFAEKGAANAKMAKRKIFHQSVMGGCYVGFGALVALSVAGNIPGLGADNPGLVKMVFAGLFPVNLLMILTTGGQLFTGNSATVAAARYEDLVDNREMVRSWVVSLLGNVVGCSLMAVAAWYAGCLTGGAADLCSKMAVGKVGGTPLQNFAKAIMCNWMVSLAVFLGGAANNLGAKLIAVWFPISLFVAIGLEHSVANLFLMPAAMLIKAGLSWNNIIFRNVLPVLLGNAVAGAVVVALSYSYQFGRVGGKQRAIFAEKLAQRQKKSPMVQVAQIDTTPSPIQLEETPVAEEKQELEQVEAEAMEETVIVAQPTEQSVSSIDETEPEERLILSIDEEVAKDATAPNETRELTQMQDANLILTAEMTDEALSLKRSREYKQLEASRILKEVQMEQGILALQTGQERKEAEEARIVGDSRLNDKQNPSNDDPEMLSSKYASIEDIGERAYQILSDLGSF